MSLSREGVEETASTWAGQYRLRATAINPCGGADPNVFLYVRRPADPYTGLEQGVCLGVCTPAEMEQYPSGVPDDGTHYPFFRLDSFDVIVETVGLADRTWSAVVVQVDVLLAAQDRLDNLTPGVTVALGRSCADPGPSSDSSSDSSSSSSLLSHSLSESIP